MAKKKSKTAHSTPTRGNSDENLTKFNDDTSKSLEPTNENLQKAKDKLTSLQTASEISSANTHNQDLMIKYLPSRRFSQGPESIQRVEKKSSDNEDMINKPKNQIHKRNSSIPKKSLLNQLAEENKISEFGLVNFRNNKSTTSEKSKEIQEEQKETVKEEKSDIFNRTYASGPVKTYYSQTKKQSLPENNIQGDDLKEGNSPKIVEETKPPITKPMTFGQKVKNKLYLEKNKDSSEYYREGRSPSVYSYSSANDSKKSLIPDIKNKNLIKAIKEDNVKEVQKWLNTKPDVNYQELNSGDTLLLVAMKLRKYEIVKILLDAGADPKIPNRTGERPFDKINDNLISAAIEERVKDVEVLLQLGANVNYQEEINNNTALHYAISKGNYPLALMLLKTGANPKKLNLLEKTPFNNLSEESQIIFMALSQDIKSSKQELTDKLNSMIRNDQDNAVEKLHQFEQQDVEGKKELVKLAENSGEIELAKQKQDTNLNKDFIDKFNENFNRQIQNINIESKKANQDIRDLQEAFKIHNDAKIKQQKVIDLLQKQIVDLEQDKLDQQEKIYKLEATIVDLINKAKLMETTKRLDILDLQNQKMNLDNQQLLTMFKNKFDLEKQVQELEQNSNRINDKLKELIADEGDLITAIRPVKVEQVKSHSGRTLVQEPKSIPTSKVQPISSIDLAEVPPSGQVQEYQHGEF